MRKTIFSLALTLALVAALVQAGSTTSVLGRASATTIRVSKSAGTAANQMSIANTSEDGGWYMTTNATAWFDGTDYPFYVGVDAVDLGANVGINWSPNNNILAGTLDTGLARSAAGVVKVTDGSSGFGTMRASNGTASVPAYGFSQATNTGIYYNSPWTIFMNAGTSYAALNYGGNGSINIASGGQFQFNSGADITAGAPDIGLARSAAGVVKVTNGSTGDGILQTALGVRGMNTKTVTDNSTTTVAIITLSRTNLQNFLDAEVQWGCYYRDDGPAYQVFRNQSHLTGVNNAGTVACAISSLSGVSSVTGGSLIGTLSVTTGTDVCNLRINCDSNLAGANPAFFAMYRLDQLGTYATIAPQ